MKMRNLMLKLAAVVLILLAVAASGIAGRAASAHGGDDDFDEWEASISGTITLLDATTFRLDGRGKADELGKVRPYSANGTFTGPNTDVLIETLTDKDGDTLTIRCEQVLEEIAPNVFRGTDSWTVIGGTGEYSGATGHGTGVTIADLNTLEFTKALDGVLALVDDD